MAEGTMTVGRIGLATASGGDGFSLFEASEIAQTDSSVTLSGLQDGLDDVELVWLRDQFLGLASGFEPTIPVTWTTWPGLDGFYVVRGVTADRTPGGLAWSLALERVADWRNPRIDQFAVYGLIDNGVSISATKSYFSALLDATQWSFPTASSNDTRTTSDGASEVWVAEVTSSSSGTVAYPSYTVPVASYYKGGARVLYDPANDGTQRLIIGRKGVTSRLDDLLITNGLVRVSWSGSAISASWYSGDNGAAGTWESAVTLNLRAGTLGLFSVDSAVVLLNTSEAVVVRCSGRPQITPVGNFTTVDLAIRRGSRTVSGYGQMTGTPAWALEGVSFPAMTAVGTPTVRYTSNDSDGNRVFLTNTSGAADAANKKVVGATQATFNFGFGFELNGSSSTSLDSMTHQIQDYFNPVTTTERIAAL